MSDKRIVKTSFSLVVGRVFRVRAVLGYYSGVDIDRELKDALQQIIELCREFDVHPRLIGGLAVRGFARRKRFTHDKTLLSVATTSRTSSWFSSDWVLSIKT
jgi:hypothetical protein